MFHCMVYCVIGRLLYTIARIRHVDYSDYCCKIVHIYSVFTVIPVRDGNVLVHNVLNTPYTVNVNHVRHYNGY
jgi:hypothetical protein